jgi:glyoxylate/hydroxypyruvate reductase A
MAETLNVLVAHSPKQTPIFRITAQEMDAAVERHASTLPNVAVEFCAVEDPGFGQVMDRAYGMIGWQFPLDLVRQSRGPLRLIQLTGAGAEHLIPFDWLPRHIALASASGIHGPKLEEWSVMTLLMLHSHIPHFATAQRRHQWSKAHSSSIAGKHALIFGTGGIGSAVARAAKRLGVRTTGVRRLPAPVRSFDSVIGMDAADEALAAADFVVLATPLTPATRGLMSAARFARMKKGACFANFGRGGLVDQDAMIGALESNHLGNAAIDVATPEPPPEDSPLWDTPRLLITPHVSCDDPATYIPSALDVFFDNLRRRLAGRKVRNRVDPVRAY